MFYFLIKPHAVFVSLLIFGMIINKNTLRRKNFLLRLFLCVAFFVVVNTQIWRLYPVELGIEMGFWHDVTTVFYFLLLLSEGFISYLVLYKTSATNVLFTLAVSYAIVDIVNSIRSVIYLSSIAGWLKENEFAVIGHYILDITICSVCIASLFKKFDLWNQPTDLKAKAVFATMITIVGLIVARFSAYIPPSTMKTITCSVYCILCDSFLLFGSFVSLDRRKKENKLKDISEIINMQYQSSQLSEEVIQELNRFAHDWKNSSLACNAEKAVTDYENMIQTGNGALDIVINEKNRLCMEHDIALRAMIDGSNLDDISALDLCALFGNALDNAIEGCMKIDDQAKRFITIRSTEDAGFRCFVIENSACGKVDIGEDGLIQTDKSDSFLHGLGVRSMQRICSQYGGKLKLYSFENLFRVVFLLPGIGSNI